MSASWGFKDSIVGECTRLVLKRPHESVGDQYFINLNWEKEGWHKLVEFCTIADDHYRLMKKLNNLGINTRCESGDWVVAMNSMMVKDKAIVTPDGGVIQCQLQAPNRLGCAQEGASYLEQLGLDNAGEVCGSDAMARGSDFVFIKKNVLLIALTSETNETGSNIVKDLCSKRNPDLVFIEVDLRSKITASDFVSDRLCSAFSMVKADTAVVCMELFPTSFEDQMKDHQINIISVTRDEWNQGSADIFALGPRKCLMVASDDNETKSVGIRVSNILKDEHGIKVHLIHFKELHMSKTYLNAFLNPYKRD